jgi:hypothetical protein
MNQQKARRLEIPPGFALYVAPGIGRGPSRVAGLSAGLRALQAEGQLFRYRVLNTSLPGTPAFFVPIWHTLNVPIWH